MGAIKDIVDLAKDLEASAKDRRDMETIHKIQSLAFSLQAHHAEIVERDVSLMQENAELKKQLAESQAEDIRIHKGIEFRRGKRTGGKWLGFCPKCHMPAEDAWIPKARGSQKVVMCSARCHWQVFMDLKLGDIAKEIDV
jgi:regulator of replication initiation timing